MKQLAEQLGSTKSRYTLLQAKKIISLAGCALIILFAFTLQLTAVPPAAAAGTAATLVLPLKINTPEDRESLTATADAALEEALASGTARRQGFRFMARDEAEKFFSYDTAWPPTAEALQKFGSQAAPAIQYIAAGSLTRLGDTISIDIKVFDLLDPSSPKFYYLEGRELTDIEQALADITGDILSYTGRSFLIASIAPDGNKRIDSGAILRNITTRAGDFYEPEKLRDDLKTVFKMGYFEDVRLKVEDTEKGKKVIFEVEEKPVIGQVVISGQDELKEEAIREVISVVPNTILNPNRTREAVENIKSLYKSKGFYNTEVATELSYPKPERVDVRFVINEGEKVYIREIRFEGNETYKDKELEKVMGTKEKGLLSWITDSGVLKREILEQDAARITAFYHNHGFIEAMVGKPVVTQEGKWLYITIDISEGSRYRVGDIDLSGDLIDEKKELLSLLELHDEEYLSRSILRQDILRLNDYYAEHGYAFAESTPTINTDREKNLVDVNIHVSKGDLVYINRITIKGNTRTRDKVIRRQLKVKEEGIFDSKALRTSHQRLQRLGFFEEVAITPEPTSDKTKMDLTVDVKERPTGAFSLGAGYSSVENLMFIAEVSQNNFLGYGQRLAFQASISGTSTKYNLSFTEPYFYDTHLLVGLDLYNWEREYDTYTRDSTGFAVRFGYPIFEKWKMNFSYGFDDTSLEDLSDDVDPSILASTNVNTTSFVSLGLSRDTRNNLFVTTEGSLNSLKLEYAGGILHGDSQYTKLEGSTSWFFPGIIADETAFHLKLAAGQVWENEADKLPDFEKFYLGGINSLRGFPSRTVAVPVKGTNDYVGGKIMWYTNLEYHFPLVKEGGLRGLVFYDAGNVYESEWNYDDIRQDVGIGFRWLSPMGPMRLEWAYVINPRPGDDSSNWEFSIGGGF